MSYQERAEAWLRSERVTKEEKEIILRSDEDTKKEMFSQDLAFGTAGMRALLGPGCSRLNHLTVRRATIGLGIYLLQTFKEDAKKRGVCISFDNRHHSKEFRDIASLTLSEMGIPVYTFRDPHPTPELSYSVRYLHCVGGIMITASHNPKEYNGYKVYDEKGCQAVYKPIEELIKVIFTLPNELEVDNKEYLSETKGEISYLDDDEMYDIVYVNKEISTSLYYKFYQGERKTKIVFTPECGCDCKVGPMALRGAGYQVYTVPGQDYFDPDFTNTKNPNPETDEAYEEAIATLKKLNAEGNKYNLILATDPDADRLGLAYLDRHGKVQRLNGNQTGALLIDFILGSLKRRNLLPMNGLICNTFVTGDQGKIAAANYGIETITTATGFKYIGNMADQIEEAERTYLFGYEESYGYLLATFVRDKDSLQSLVAIADMTEFYLRQGKTLDMALEELDKKTGHFYNTQVSISFKGPDSLSRMKTEVNKVRENPFQEVNGFPIRDMFDYQKRIIHDFVSGTEKPLVDDDIDISDCLRFNFQEGGFLAIRPSGTEPKVKFYFEIVGKSDEESQKIVDLMMDEIKTNMGL